MKTITVITGNLGKFKEIQSFFTDPKFFIQQKAYELEEIQATDARAIITHKVQEALKLGLSDFIVEDTSLYIDGMNNLPGPLIKWFLKEVGLQGLCAMAKQFGNMSARAETILAYVDQHKKIHLFIGTTTGRIIEPSGQSGFGWDAIFVPDGHQQSYAEMSFEEKNRVSHRVRALEQLKKYFMSLHDEL